MFFTNLADLLGGGTSRLNILLSKSTTGDEITVVVIPTVEGDEKLKSAIARPLSLTGTAAELDAEFAGLLGQYATQRKSLSDQINAELTIMAADAKASAKRATDKLQSKKEKAKAGSEMSTATPSAADPDDEADDQNDESDAQASSEASGTAESAAPATAPAETAKANPLAGLDLFA